ncbi:MAG: hypothetical protein DWQ19_11815 [Crenarchaeota archaeon]|nr:MAG: hypothetical protein DWQ19_11815 [Thermoproteota archaeon]
MLNNWKFHHIGYAAKDASELVLWLKSLNYTFGEEVYDPIQNVFLTMCHNPNQPNVEIIRPNDKNNKLNTIGFYHVCYEVPSIETALENLNKEKVYYLIIQEPKPAILFDNRKICFIKTKIGIVELLEV